MVRTSQDSGFKPQDLSKAHPVFQLPDEIWISMLETACTFEPEFYLKVMLNLIKNPNLTSSYLFRAEIFYDSHNDVSVSQDPASEHFSNFTKHMKAEYRPIRTVVPGYGWQRTVVRRMIPRNPQLDRSLVQTCHLFHSQGTSEERNLVIYIPHVSSAEEVPWYHPTAQKLALLHTWKKDTPDNEEAARGSISIHYRLFPNTHLDTRLERIALNLLKLIHKHGQGQQAGYVKRVHHDLLVPQAAFQDTYTRLKVTYAKELIREWVEQTDPAKHVFEDLGIAAFLIELWAQMYSGVPNAQQGEQEQGGRGGEAKPPFPGFVDIGCGNGVLVYVLRQEGYEGWGFDARRRKTWDTFPAHVRANLGEMLLVPKLLQSASASINGGPAPPSTAHEHEHDAVPPLTSPTAHLRIIHDTPPHGATTTITPPPSTEPTAPSIPFHSGVFPANTFIISNHADELTAWTPLLAYLSSSPFIAIPCCSHNLAGARFRAPAPPRVSSPPASSSESKGGGGGGGSGGGKPPAAAKAPSAYASLCAYVGSLAEEVGFVVEREMLRIPSTRNAAVVGRRRRRRGGDDDEGVDEDEDEDEDEDAAGRERKVRGLLMREVGSVEVVGAEWVERAARIAGSKGDGH